MNTRLDLKDTHPCIWMSAGLLRYKLCDRAFDCDHCPLDAALRGQTSAAAGAVSPEDVRSRPASVTFPADRRYSAGHVWLKPMNGTLRRVRFGLDAFATSLMKRPRQVSVNASAGTFRRGDTICSITFDDGELPIVTPISATLGAQNDALGVNPGIVFDSPYEAGWIGELGDVEPGALDEFAAADTAEEQARLDMRMLRRRIAMYLLASSSGVGPTLPDGGELLSDPFLILGGRRYLELVGEFVR